MPLGPTGALPINLDAMASEAKHRRPFASGALPVVAGPPLVLALLGLNFGITWLCCTKRHPTAPWTLL